MLPATCPQCGRSDTVLLSRIEAHRLSDDNPEFPYLVTFTFGCVCGTTFQQIVGSPNESQAAGEAAESANE